MSNSIRRPRNVPTTPERAKRPTPFQSQASGALRAASSAPKSTAGNAMFTASTSRKPASTGMRVSATRVISMFDAKQTIARIA